MGTDGNADDAVVVVPLDVEAVTVVAIMVTVAMMNQYENMRVTAIDARCTQDTR